MVLKEEMREKLQRMSFIKGGNHDPFDLETPFSLSFLSQILSPKLAWMIQGFHDGGVLKCPSCKDYIFDEEGWCCDLGQLYMDRFLEILEFKSLWEKIRLRPDDDNEFEHVERKMGVFIPDLEGSVREDVLNGKESLLIDLGDVDTSFKRDPILIATTPRVIGHLKKILDESIYLRRRLRRLLSSGNVSAKVELRFCNSCWASKECLESDEETIHYHVVGTEGCIHCCVSAVTSIYVMLHLPARND